MRRRSRAIKARHTRSRAIKARHTRSRAIKARLTRRPRERRESAARRTSHTPAPSASLWAPPSDRDASVAACRAPPSHRQGTGRGNAGWSVSRVRQCAAEPSAGFVSAQDGPSAGFVSAQQSRQQGSSVRSRAVSRVRQCAAEPSAGFVSAQQSHQQGSSVRSRAISRVRQCAAERPREQDEATQASGGRKCRVALRGHSSPPVPIRGNY